jgi:TonB family protein
MALALLALFASSGSMLAQSRLFPARLIAGEPPPLPAQNIAGGQVIVEASVNDVGSVGSVTVLRSSPPFDELVIAAVRGWRFSPAEETRPDGTRVPVVWPVIVAAVSRPPTLYNGPGIGEPPRDVASATDRVPFPVSIVVPSFPPLALEGGAVVLEAEIQPSGVPAKIRVARSGPGFDAAAVEALGQWRFRPARTGSSDGNSPAYVIMGFSQPVLSDPRGRPGR